MISWVQRNFQQHFRIIFGLVLIGTIVSFVVTIGATSNIGYGDRRTATQDFFGRNLGSAGELNQIVHDAAIKAGKKLCGPFAWKDRPDFTCFQAGNEMAAIARGVKVELGEMTDTQAKPEIGPFAARTR